MTLQYSKNNTAVQEIESKLIELSLAFDKKETPEAKDPILVDGGQKISGQKAILEHLRLLESELKSWYYCSF